MRSAIFLASLGLLASSLFGVDARQHRSLRRRDVTFGNVFAKARFLPTTNASNGTSIKDPAYDPKFVHFDCATNQSHASDHLLQTIKSLHDDKAGGAPGAKLRARALRARQSGAVTIPAVFHIVSSNAAASNITKDMPSKQVDQLNKMYAPVGFQFDLVNTTWTTNDAWAVGSGDDITNMQKALRQGNYSTLNIYFMSDLAGSILGKCSMPSDIGPSPQASDYFDDGCTVNSGTMPGGSIYGYDQGMTAVHETGHWLGLFHVFEGYTCDGDGDFISDTPMQSQSTDGCPTGDPPQDSCPNSPGVDAIHNIMDYSTDACYTGFSPLQIERMKNMWGLYRQGN